VRHARRLALEADQFEDLGDDLADGVARLADDLEREGDVLRDGLVVQQPEVLEDAADGLAQAGDPAPGHAHHVEVRYVDTPLGRHLFPQQQAQKGRLARPGCADEEDELAFVHLDGDVLQRGARGGLVHLRNVFEPDHEARVYLHPLSTCCLGSRRR
jgi:hypothetical protein